MASPAKRRAKEPVAIIGSACRFAGGVNSPSELWHLLQDPQDVRSEITEARFEAKGFYHPNHAHHGRGNVMHSYLLESDPSVFDADFFGIKPVEAQAMDPQQRMLLETVYEAVEAAGHSIHSLRDSDTGVFVGAMSADYEAIQLRDLDQIPTYFATGMARSILSNRISHFFGWHGPCMTIDTACSSSLVALHQAVQALRSGESEMAVVGGSNLILGPESFIMESKLNMLSPDGIGRMWDQDANGYARGEGVAALVLKPLSSAIADGDKIDCVIAETGVNQDGHTPGITMPSAASQEALIRRTYANAGLDLRLAGDRPQFFEAHGTGTPAGDPVEAEAISRAFFGPDMTEEQQSLSVGSIKTVLGHTEGTAGLAGILKASLAIQHGRIPPNLHFNKLSPAVAPFYHNVEIPTSAADWPDIPDGGPRRASVNSFGFGGTNAHCILEEYRHGPTLDDLSSSSSNSGNVFTPFVFSASSESALKANLRAIAVKLSDKDGPSEQYNAQDLAYTLAQRRSILPYRISFMTPSLKSLSQTISDTLNQSSESPDNSTQDSLTIKVSASSRRPTILGLFTGQGAQYPRMGAGLVKKSPLFARRIISDLDAHLAALPDPPSWTLLAELLASPADSRVDQAEISQPLCTAVQILLVDLLRAAGVGFEAVVGHSSGEIAAAYAAGYLSARDAIVVAYYRGLHCRRLLLETGGGSGGAMLAVGTTAQDARELCADELFVGRISLAAENSPSSVTISGDADAIEELKDVMDDEGKFNRRLKVDMAYHSRHMLPCLEPYAESLRRARVLVRNPLAGQEDIDTRRCRWYSSVHGGEVDAANSGLKDIYWAENLTKPVLFRQALLNALRADSGYHDGDVMKPSFDLVLEVGAHPALKAPASQVLDEVSSQQNTVPYHGCLNRGVDAIQAMGTCLGYMWSCLARPGAGRNDVQMPDLMRYESALSGYQNFELVKGLPPYQWNHETKYWHESRRSRRFRLRNQVFHPLLGDQHADSGPHHLRWKNILKPSEMAWFQGHQVHGQIVFPAAGYVSTAIEAAKSLAEAVEVGREKLAIVLIELNDFVIHQAISFSDEDSGVEIMVELGHIRRTEKRKSNKETQVIRAKFTYLAVLGPRNTDIDLELVASGDVRIVLSDTASLKLLPRRGPSIPHLIDVEPHRLYRFMDGLGYNFSGPFQSLGKLRRKVGKASCELATSLLAPLSSLLLDPVVLDAAFQSIMLAHSYPGDDQLRSLHLPVSIAKVRLNPAAFCSSSGTATNISVDSTCTRLDRQGLGPGFTGDVSLYRGHLDNAALQVECLRFVPFVGSSTSPDSWNFPEGGLSDRNKVFSTTEWVLANPDGVAAAEGVVSSASLSTTTELLWVLSRIACYFFRQFDDSVPADSPLRTSPPLSHYLHYAKHMTELLRSGRHKYARTEWLSDSLDDIQRDVSSKGFAANADVRLMVLVGHTMPRIFAGEEITMIEEMRSSSPGLLDDYYTHGIGTQESVRWIGRVVKQLADRNPHLNIIEVGAGTGGATKNILREIGQRDGHDVGFDSYTFTDISSSFFEKAAEELFPDWVKTGRMVFKVFDAEKDHSKQEAWSGDDDAGQLYDVVVASLVIHATAELRTTLRNLRRLLKPGGYLVVAEGTSDGPFQSGGGFIFGTLPGWWRGVEEGRTLTPFVDMDEWELLLKTSGFSGMDTVGPEEWLDTFGLVLFVSQAVDETIEFLRRPLGDPSSRLNGDVVEMPPLVLIGGVTGEVLRLVDQVKTVFRNGGIIEDIVHFTTLESLNDSDPALLGEDVNVLCLAELDEPVFKSMTADKWAAFQRLFASRKRLLWVSAGRLSAEPWSNMPVGFSRSAVNETAELHVQFLDFPTIGHINARVVAESLARFCASTSPNFDPSALLWPVEPELVFDTLGRCLVPRLKYMPYANERYASVEQTILHEAEIEKTRVELHKSAAGFRLVETPRLELERLRAQRAADESVQGWPKRLRLKLVFFSASAFKTSQGDLFLVAGTDIGETHGPTRRLIAFVPKVCSVLDIQEDCVAAYTVPCRNRGGSNELIISEAGFFSAVVSRVLASFVLKSVPLGKTVATHNAPPLVRQAIAHEASSRGLGVICLTDGNNEQDMDTSRSDSLVTAELGATQALTSTAFQLPLYVSRSHIASILPTDLVCYVDFTPDGRSENEDAIGAALPHYCRLETIATLFAREGPSSNQTWASPSHGLTETLQGAVLSTQLQVMTSTDTDLEAFHSRDDILSVGDLVTGKTLKDTNPLAVVDWTAQPSAPVQVTRLDAEPMFKHDKTYWICGMSGALGISTCDWMIDRGVKHLVVSSRNPKVEDAWCLNHRRNGVVVEIMSCDVTHEEELKDVHRRITDTMPPIAGVLNGAMVLKDSAVANMTHKQLMDVIRPKVLGSLYLDRMFYEVPLDFFILVSSINCVIGNPGQANYAAANMFMCGLAASRRKRGLNAVAVNGGAIIGAGYITRESERALEATVQKMAMMHLSEEDFHQIIAEAVECGRPDSANPGSSSEFTTGILPVSSASSNIPKWYSDPRLSRFVVHQSASGEQKKKTMSVASIQEQLQACRTKNELSLLISRSFGNQLRKVLQASVTDEEILIKSGGELGLDSLISADIRSWFLRHFRVSIPALRILSNETMENLVQAATRDTPADLTPLIPLHDDLTSPPTLADAGEAIDWEAEGTLPDDLATMESFGNQGPRPACPPRVVILTGATGLLGHHMVRYLLKQPSIKKVHCIALRQRNGSLGRSDSDSSPPNSRVIYHPGDLSAPNLGLSPTLAHTLFQQADAVIHNGADTSHAQPYAALRSTNVGSTLCILRLCLPRRIPIHYVSSAGVSIYFSRPVLPEVPVTYSPDLLPPDGAFGYACTKWINERLLEKAHALYGLQVGIYRPSTIIRAGHDATTAKAELDWVNALLKYTRLVQAAPRVEWNTSGVLDLVKVETCCRDIWEGIMGMMEKGKSGESETIPVKYVNCVGDRLIPLAGLGEMDRECDRDSKQGQRQVYETVPMKEWIERAVSAGLHPAVAGLIERMDAPGVEYPRIVRGSGLGV